MSHLSPKQAAQALGVSESSVKRWCDLGTVPVIRTAGGHRRIPLKSLEDFLSGGADLSSTADPGSRANSDEDQKPSVSPSDTRDQGDRLVQIQARFAHALVEGDEDDARSLIAELIESGFAKAQAVDFLVTDAMRRLGVRWENGELAIYQERRACGICSSLMQELRRSIATPEGAPIAIGGAASGDLYQLPTQMIELALCEMGWKATSLGCNLPIESFTEAIREYKPQLLWLSLSDVPDRERLVVDFNQMVDHLPEETVVIIGGRAATDSLRPRLRYSAHCDSLDHLMLLTSRIRAKLQT